MRFLLTGLAVVIGVGIGSSRAAAQPLGPGLQRPAFSPYLNLNRPGTNPAINYFGLVRPQTRALSAMQGMEQQIQSNLSAINALGATNTTGIPDTGHRVSFLNTGGYFMNMNPGRGMGGQGGTSFGNLGGGGSGFQGNAGIRNRTPWQNSLSQPRGSMGRIR